MMSIRPSKLFKNQSR